MYHLSNLAELLSNSGRLSTAWLVSLVCVTCPNIFYIWCYNIHLGQNRLNHPPSQTLAQFGSLWWCVLDWFSSYISSRIQTASVHSFTSVPALVYCRLPRGSVLSHICFRFYTLSLSTFLTIITSSTNHTLTIPNSRNLLLPIAKFLASLTLCGIAKNIIIKECMTDNKVKLNDDKTEIMNISPSRMSTSFSIRDYFATGNTSVPFSVTINHLGVTLDCHLYSKPNVVNHIRTANFGRRRISFIRHLLITREPSDF